MLVVIQREYQCRSERMQTGDDVRKSVLAHVLVGPFEVFRLLLALAVHVNELFHQGERGC